MLKLLQGIKILDLTRLLPGPLCTLYLADLGAEVIKIEPPDGDYTQDLFPHAYTQLNRDKKILTLDLKNKADLLSFLELVKDCQVVVESFRPGVTKRLGIDFATLKILNPSLVYCSITGYGQTGPYKDLPGHDINYLAYAGILEQSGKTDGKPMLANFQIADIAGGTLSSCVAILAALIDSIKNGVPHYLDVSMLDCATALNQMALASYQSEMKNVPRGKDKLSGGFPFYGIYETSDHRFMALGTLEYKFWKVFCEVVNRPEWIAWHEQDKTQYIHFESEIAALFKKYSLVEWTKLMEGKQCCVSPVLNLSETMENPQIKSRQIFEKDGKAIKINFPIKFKT